MTTKKAVLLGCGIAALAGFLAVAAVVGFIFYVSQDVKGVAVAVNSPTDVVGGQTFELAVVVTNERPRKAMALTDIDIEEAYLSGFTVSSIDPNPKSSMHVPVANSRSFTFDTPIPVGGTRTYTFKLRAEKPGVHRGDIDVCEGSRSISTMAQTSVKEKP